MTLIQTVISKRYHLALSCHLHLDFTFIVSGGTEKGTEDQAITIIEKVQ